MSPGCLVLRLSIPSEEERGQDKVTELFRSVGVVAGMVNQMQSHDSGNGHGHCHNVGRGCGPTVSLSLSNSEVAPVICQFLSVICVI